jgi:NADH dehydrogenase [ubiquinone] 1 alpha subcomplex assembly factor 7
VEAGLGIDKAVAAPPGPEALLVCPRSPCLKWQTKMTEKFGLMPPRDGEAGGQFASSDGGKAVSGAAEQKPSDIEAIKEEIRAQRVKDGKKPLASSTLEVYAFRESAKRFRETPEGQKQLKSADPNSWPAINEAVKKEIIAKRVKEGKKPLAESTLESYASKETSRRWSETPKGKERRKLIEEDAARQAAAKAAARAVRQPTEEDAGVRAANGSSVPPPWAPPAPEAPEPKERPWLVRLFTRDTPYEQAQQDLRREARAKARAEAAAARKARWEAEAPVRAAAQAKAKAKKDAQAARKRAAARRSREAATRAAVHATYKAIRGRKKSSTFSNPYRRKSKSFWDDTHG